MRKIIWLVVNNMQVTISVMLQYFMWQMKVQLLQLYWMKIWHEFKRKNSFTLSKSCMKTERFLLPVKSSLFHIWIEERDPKAKENLPVVFRWPSLQLFFKRLKNSVPCSSLSLTRRNSSTSTSCFNQNAGKQSYNLPRNRFSIHRRTFIKFIWLLPDFNFFTGHYTG